MPVPLARPDDDDVSRPNESALLLGCDDPFTLDDMEGLVGCMNMGPRPRARLKEDRDQIYSTRLRRWVQALLADRAAEIPGILRSVRLFRLHSDYSHSCPPAFHARLGKRTAEYPPITSKNALT